MRTLIVIAEKEELKLVNELGFKDYSIMITGVGALNIMESLRDIPRDTKIINIGYAGSKNLEPGKFYNVGYATLHHPNVSYIEPIYNLNREPIYELSGDYCYYCYTGCDFVLKSDYNDCLFDMEIAYIMGMGFTNVTSYKYVSDNLDLAEYRKTLN